MKQEALAASALRIIAPRSCGLERYFLVEDGLAAYQLVGEVVAHQGFDG